MACADQLCSRPDLFDVTVVEVGLLPSSILFRLDAGLSSASFLALSQSAAYCGGQAFSISVDPARFGTNWLNQGVQGGSHVYHHTIHMMAKQNLQPAP